MKLPKKVRIFSDVTTVSRSAAITLNHKRLIKDDDVLVGWPALAPYLINRAISDTEAKQLVLLELYRADGGDTRKDIVDRLVNYISRIDRDDTRNKISKLID